MLNSQKLCRGFDLEFKFEDAGRIIIHLSFENQENFKLNQLLPKTDQKCF